MSTQDMTRYASQCCGTHPLQLSGSPARRSGRQDSCLLWNRGLADLHLPQDWATKRINQSISLAILNCIIFNSWHGIALSWKDNLQPTVWRFQNRVQLKSKSPHIHKVTSTQKWQQQYGDSQWKWCTVTYQQNSVFWPESRDEMQRHITVW